MKVLCKNIIEQANSFDNTAIRDDSISDSAKYFLPTLKAVEELSLYLGDTQITDKSVCELFGAISNIGSNIRRLLLMLSGTKISDQSIEIFHRETPPSTHLLESSHPGFWIEKI